MKLNEILKSDYTKPIKIIRNYTVLRDFYDETGDPIGEVDREDVDYIKSPFAYSPTRLVYTWQDKKIVVVEVSHRIFYVYQIPDSIKILPVIVNESFKEESKSDSLTNMLENLYASCKEGFNDVAITNNNILISDMIHKVEELRLYCEKRMNSTNETSINNILNFYEKKFKELYYNCIDRLRSEGNNIMWGSISDINNPIDINNVIAEQIEKIEVKSADFKKDIKK
jgi:hypothetical protein